LTGIIAVFLISILAQVLVNYAKVTGVLKIQPLKLILTADMSVIQGQKQEILKFVKHNYISQTWSMVIANLDTLALGFYRAPSEVGIYKMAKNFYSVAARMIEPFSVVIYPNLALLWSSENYLKYASLIRKSTAVVMLTATPLLIILSVFIPYILNYTVGNSFHEASDLTRILLVGGWVTAIFFWTRPSILVMGKTHVPPTVNFVNVVMVIGLTLYFVPLYGSMGSALICLVPILFGNIIVAYAVLKTYRERLKVVSVIN
jgi:O-antigen/teichoic acid export membrane protein